MALPSINLCVPRAFKQRVCLAPGKHDAVFLEDSIAPSSGRPVEQFVPTEDAILQQPLSQPD